VRADAVPELAREIGPDVLQSGNQIPLVGPVTFHQNQGVKDDRSDHPKFHAEIIVVFFNEYKDLRRIGRGASGAPWDAVARGWGSLCCRPRSGHHVNRCRGGRR
jgi:hypothetical protein